MNILLVDDKVPDPQFGAGFPRAYRLLLTLLSLGHKIYFVPILTSSIKDLDLERLSEFGVTVLDSIKKVPAADVVIMSRPHNVHYHLPVVRNQFPKARVVYDTEALWFRRYDLQLSITGKLPGWAYRYDEIGLAKQVDLCFVVNDIEKAILLDAGVQKVVKLGHALDLNPEGMEFEDRADFLVVGGKMEEDSSNEDALWWYLENAWEKVSAATGTVIDVAGLPVAKRLHNHPFSGVNLLGLVDDLVPLYEGHKVFVATTRFATGIPWKVHEAMANGIPCLISPLLANQLALKWDEEAMVASTPEEAVEKSIRLYQDKDLWERLRKNGYNLILRDCNPYDFKAILQANLTALVS